MILDSSVVVAVVLREPGYEMLAARIATEQGPGIGTPTLVETSIVLTRKAGPTARTVIARFLQEAGAAVLPFEEAHWPVALDAFERFGKGRHPAALNFGDCLTYATARLAAEPLLALGDEFGQTDLELVSL